jgi:hypothetical protein
MPDPGHTIILVMHVVISDPSHIRFLYSVSLSSSSSTGAVDQRSSVTTIRVSSSGAFCGDALPRVDAMVISGSQRTSSYRHPSMTRSLSLSVLPSISLFMISVADDSLHKYHPSDSLSFLSVLIESLLSFRTSHTPLFLLGVCDVDPTRYCVKLRDADGFDIR